MNNMPGWCAPLVGLLIGGGGGLWVAQDMKFNPPSVRPVFIAVTAVMGLVAGLIVWLVDRRKRK